MYNATFSRRAFYRSNDICGDNSCPLVSEGTRSFSASTPANVMCNPRDKKSVEDVIMISGGRDKRVIFRLTVLKTKRINQ